MLHQALQYASIQFNDSSNQKMFFDDVQQVLDNVYKVLDFAAQAGLDFWRRLKRLTSPIIILNFDQI